MSQDIIGDGPTVLPEDKPGRSHHDLGGVSRYACDAVDTSEHTLTDFDRTVDAIRQVLSMRGLLRTDELRRGIEALPPATYDTAPYYQKWLFSIVNIMVEKGLVSEADLRKELGL